MGQPKEYRDIKALSQSSLKLLDQSPRKFYETEYQWLIGAKDKPEIEVSDAMRLGELVDCLLLTPSDFSSSFVVHTGETPTGQMLDFTNKYFKQEKEQTNNYEKKLEQSEIDQIAENVYIEVGFKRDSRDTVLKRFKTEALDYYKSLRAGIGRAVISPEMHLKALRMVDQLNANEFTGPILNPGPDVEKLVQLPIYKEDFCQFRVPVKGLLDLVLIDHSTKIISTYDLKTTSEFNFTSSYISRRYDIQGSLYNELSMYLIGDMKLGGYKVKDSFKFIVGSTIGGMPEIWKMNFNDLKTGRLGGKNLYGRTIKGFKGLIDDYKWHVENNKWDYPKEVYENNGVRLFEPLN